MEEIITRATNSINEILESLKVWYSDPARSQLINIRYFLNRLLQLDSPRNDWARLFCRQLNRLMDYNKSLSENFWIKLRDDIVCALEGPNGEQGTGFKWNCFLKKINYEKELEQRELQFQQTFGERKTLHKLLVEHKKFFEVYLHKCISLHSKVPVRVLVENLDDFLCNCCGLTETSFARISPKCLKEKLEYIEIPLDSSNTSMSNIDEQIFTDHSLRRRVNNNLSNFIPSVEARFGHGYSSKKTVEEVLKSERWVVVLGDPGSAKTSLLRWITCVFAEAAHRGDEEVLLKGVDRIPVRIPILIRIGEFATWLSQYQNKTLMDYIGKHTWLSQPYINNDDGSVLRELIYHGHALILLDGLDEIPEVGRRGEIVDLVKIFIKKYVRTPDFVSAFDDTMFEAESSLFIKEIIQMQPPRKHGGNQIIITSRIVGYQLYPIICRLSNIIHCYC